MRQLRTQPKHSKPIKQLQNQASAGFNLHKFSSRGRQRSRQHAVSGHCNEIKESDEGLVFIHGLLVRNQMYCSKVRGEMQPFVAPGSVCSHPALPTLGGATPLLRHRPSPVLVSLCVCPCAPECYIREGRGGGPTPMPGGQEILQLFLVQFCGGL